MLLFEAETNLSKKWIDGNFYYFLWGNSFPNDVYQLMKEKNPPKGFYVVGPEEWEPVTLFYDPFVYECFKYYIEANNIDFKVIAGAIMDKDNINYDYAQDPYFANHPTYFAHCIVTHAVDNKVTPFGINKNKILKLFTSLNGRPHPWRCEFIDTMYANKLFDDGYISWHELDHDNDVYEYDWKHWTPQKMEFDVNWQRTDGMKDLYFPPNEFQTSAISLISESNTRCLFYAEKTFVPIFHKRAFFIYGAPYANTYLEKMGFKIFDNVIDYSFDSILDDTERCNAYFKEVNKLKQIPHTELVEMLQPRVEHNYTRMLEIVENKEYVPDIWNTITKENSNHDHLVNYNRILNIADTDEYKEWKEKHENSINR